MEIQWPLILFTFFNCLAGGIFLMQGILTLSGKGKAMQLASCISAIVALAIGGLSVFFHLQHPLRMLNGFGHITSGITIELIFVIVFAIAVVLYFLMMRRSEEGLAPKWCAVLAIVVSLALPFATGDSYLMSAIPVWDTMLLPLYYVVATVMLGGLAAMIIAGATKAADAVKLSATVAFIGAVVCAVVSVIYAVAISGMGANLISSVWALTTRRWSTTSTRRCLTWPCASPSRSPALFWPASMPWPSGWAMWLSAARCLPCWRPW